jgi:hypothetical protein
MAGAAYNCIPLVLSSNKTPASAWLARGFWHALEAAQPLTLPGKAAYNEAR